MASSLDLAGMRTRVRNVLMDAGAAVWADDQLDQGIRSALEEYSRAGRVPGAPVRGRELIATVTPAAGAREVDLSALADFVALERVWYPYLGTPGESPHWIRFELFWDDAAPMLRMLSALGDGVSTARCFYYARHTLEDLDGATVTTFDAGDENLLAGGAAGHACLMRSADLNETAANMAVSTPNYAALANLYLTEFRAALQVRRVQTSGPSSQSAAERTGWLSYDASLLEMREL